MKAELEGRNLTNEQLSVLTFGSKAGFRLMGTCKKYVRSRAYPEGSIAETYIVKEALTFSSIYLSNVETLYDRLDRHDGGGVRPEKGDVFAQRVRPLSWKSAKYLSNEEIEVIQWEHANLLMPTSMDDTQGR